MTENLIKYKCGFILSVRHCSDSIGDSQTIEPQVFMYGFWFGQAHYKKNTQWLLCESLIRKQKMTNALCLMNCKKTVPSFSDLWIYSVRSFCQLANRDGMLGGIRGSLSWWRLYGWVNLGYHRLQFFPGIWVPILQSVRKQQPDIIRTEGFSLHSVGSGTCQGGSHLKRKKRTNGDKLDHLLQGKLI